MRPVFFCGSTQSLRCACDLNSVEWQTYGKIDISWRGGKRYGFEGSGRSGGQAAGCGVREFLKVTRTAGPGILTAARWSEEELTISAYHPPAWTPRHAGRARVNRR